MKRYQEAVKKVIFYMTLGIDVTKLFSEMIMVRVLLPKLSPRIARDVGGSMTSSCHGFGL